MTPSHARSRRLRMGSGMKSCAKSRQKKQKWLKRWKRQKRQTRQKRQIRQTRQSRQTRRPRKLDLCHKALIPHIVQYCPPPSRTAFAHQPLLARCHSLVMRHRVKRFPSNVQTTPKLTPSSTTNLRLCARVPHLVRQNRLLRLLYLRYQRWPLILVLTGRHSITTPLSYHRLSTQHLHTVARRQLDINLPIRRRLNIRFPPARARRQAQSFRMSWHALRLRHHALCCLFLLV